jgi:hypothetical protein
MMDRTSSYMTGKRIQQMHLDGAKLLWRWVPGGEKNDRYALETLERVAKAVEELAELNLPAFVEPLPVTTMPVLLLGGESTGKPSGTIEDFVRGMGAGPNIRGALVGRNVLFCGEDDPAAIAEAINLVVHKGYSAIEAIREAAKIRTHTMDFFS